jgi:hypothetical protein
LCSLGVTGKDHAKLVYNDTAILPTMAIADDVLVGIKSVEDLQALEIPPGEDELRLIYAEGAEDKVILRKCIKVEGVTDVLMPQSAFLAIYQNGLKMAGYFYRISIHRIRRYLGKRIDGKILLLKARSLVVRPLLQWPVGRSRTVY